MLVKDIKEVFNDYKKVSLLVATSKCDFKCEKEGLCQKGTCQNSHLVNSPDIEISNDKIVKMFNENELVDALIIGGLESMLQFGELTSLINEFRKTNNEDIVIFTGYYPYELYWELEKLKEFGNIIVKFGRYVENLPPKYDKILGIELVSNNQYAIKIS